MDPPVHPRQVSAALSPAPGTFRGGAFFGEERAFGLVTVGPGGIRFSDDAGAGVTLPFSGLALVAGGANDGTLFLTHPSAPGWTVFTADFTLLDHPELASRPDILSRITAIRRKRARGWLVLAALLAVCVGIAWGAFALKDPLVDALANRVPVEWERRMGDLAFQSYAVGRVVEDPEAVQALERLTGPVLKRATAAAGREIPFRVHLVRDPDLNAVALPGGVILLNAGLVSTVDSPGEIAGVTAHEAAHVVRRHGLRQLISTVGIFAVIQSFFGDVSGLMAVLADQSAMLLTRKYSRDHEREADDLGWEYLMSGPPPTPDEAGVVGPEAATGMIRFFERLAEKEADLGEAGRLLTYVSTHPDTRERLERLRERAKSLPPVAAEAASGPATPLRRDLEALKSRVAVTTSPLP